MNIINKHFSYIIFTLALAISIFSTLYYYTNGLIVQFGDAAARLDIARKIVDNLTPGFGQLGNIWLPLPHILMLPFIGNDFLWHSGLAGSLMSGTAFIAMALFIYKSIRLVSNSIIAGLIAVLVLFTNINILYMQTTAMSEILFISTLSGAIYFLLKWAKDDSKGSLIFGAGMIAANSLTRYEGYFLVFFSVPLIVLISFLKSKKWKNAEGEGIIFTTLALGGIILWSVYLWAIFKNPFYWKDIYSHKVSIISTDEVTKMTIVDSATKVNQLGNLVNSLSSYWTSIAHMNGVVISVFATLILFIFFIYLLLNKNLTKKNYLLVLLLPLSVFIFVVFTLYNGGIPLEQPELNLLTLMDRKTGLTSEYNIRYGLNMAPFVALLLGWFAGVNRVFRGIAILIILIQFSLIYLSNYYIIYQLPLNYANANNGMSLSQGEAVGWLKDNYDGGLIMISALKHDPVMFNMGIDYKNFIHEGTGKYWISSRKSPEKYASWIYMYKPAANTSRDEDSVTKYIAKNPILKARYTEAYKNGSIVIYKIKDRPDVEVK